MSNYRNGFPEYNGSGKRNLNKVKREIGLKKKKYGLYEKVKFGGVNQVPGVPLPVQ